MGKTKSLAVTQCAVSGSALSQIFYFFPTGFQFSFLNQIPLFDTPDLERQTPHGATRCWVGNIRAQVGSRILTTICSVDSDPSKFTTPYHHLELLRLRNVRSAGSPPLTTCVYNSHDRRSPRYSPNGQEFFLPSNRFDCVISFAF